MNDRIVALGRRYALADTALTTLVTAAGTFAPVEGLTAEEKRACEVWGLSEALLAECKKLVTLNEAERAVARTMTGGRALLTRGKALMLARAVDAAER